MEVSLRSIWLVVTVLLIFLSGCAGPKSAGKVESEAGTQKSGDSSVSTSGAGLARGAEEATLDLESANSKSTQKFDEVLPAKQTVYFAYDSSVVSVEGTKIIRAQADFLLKNSKLRVQLEGHTDSRGTREYNLALGERRAKAVQQILLTLGVDRNRIETVSYGEERPVDPQENEMAWAKNRRVEFVYPNK